jgi:hypothetical protein
VQQPRHDLGRQVRILRERPPDPEGCGGMKEKLLKICEKRPLRVIKKSF